VLLSLIVLFSLVVLTCGNIMDRCRTELRIFLRHGHLGPTVVKGGREYRQEKEQVLVRHFQP